MQASPRHETQWALSVSAHSNPEGEGRFVGLFPAAGDPNEGEVARSLPKLQASIRLDRESAAYQPGETIAGTLYVRANTTVFMTDIGLRFCGRELHRLDSRRVLHRTFLSLAGTLASFAQVIRIGSYEFPFSLKLPERCSISSSPHSGYTLPLPSKQGALGAAAESVAIEYQLLCLFHITGHATPVEVALDVNVVAPVAVAPPAAQQLLGLRRVALDVKVPFTELLATRLQALGSRHDAFLVHLALDRSRLVYGEDFVACLALQNRTESCEVVQATLRLHQRVFVAKPFIADAITMSAARCNACVTEDVPSHPLRATLLARHAALRPQQRVKPVQVPFLSLDQPGSFRLLADDVLLAYPLSAHRLSERMSLRALGAVEQIDRLPPSTRSAMAADALRFDVPLAKTRSSEQVAGGVFLRPSYAYNAELEAFMAHGRLFAVQHALSVQVTYRRHRTLRLLQHSKLVDFPVVVCAPQHSGAPEYVGAAPPDLPIGWAPQVNETLRLQMAGVAGAGVAVAPAPRPPAVPLETPPASPPTPPLPQPQPPSTAMLSDGAGDSGEPAATLPHAQSISSLGGDAGVPMAVAFAVTAADLTNASGTFASLVRLAPDALSLPPRW